MLSECSGAVSPAPQAPATPAATTAKDRELTVQPLQPLTLATPTTTTTTTCTAATPAAPADGDDQQAGMGKLRRLLSDISDDVQNFDFVFDTNIDAIDGGEDSMFTYSVPALVVPPR